MKKPTPQQIEELRAANPKGAPRFDYREMELVVERAESAAQGDGGEDPETIPVAISSERAVLRYDWWNDEMFYEVLAHGKDSVDLSYAADGLPFIAGHRSWDADSQHGIVENVRVEKKVLRGDIRMSRAARSQEIKNDLVDGIRRKVSVGYILGDEYEQSKPDKDGIPTRTYTAWMPIEVSTVPIPADYDVGIGRTKSAAGQAALARFLQLHPGDPTRAAAPQPNTTEAPKAKEITVEKEKDTAPGGAPDLKVVRNEGVTSERTRVTNISQLAHEHRCEDKLGEWLSSGKTESEVTGEINKILSERLKKTPATEISRGVQLSDKDLKRFSYARAILAGIEDPREVGASIDFGLEKEVMQEARKRTPFSAGKGGILIPFVTPHGRANVDSATSTTGGAFKFTQGGDFIDLLRNATSVMRAGAKVIPGLTGPVAFPKQTGAATGTWVAENPGSDMARSAPAFTTVSLAFKTIQSAVAVSRQALFTAAGGNYDLEQIIREDLARVIALAIDLGALNGSGTGQPLGILQDTSVGAAGTLGTNGGTIAWTNVVDLETTVGAANAVGRMSYLTNSKQRGRARNIAVLAATNSGIPVWQGSPSFPDAGGGTSFPPGGDGIVNGYPAFVSNQVPSNLTKGTATTICSAWVFGAFEQILVGMFGAGFEVLVDPYTLKLQNMIDLTAWNFVDVADRYPVAFSTLKDAL